MRILLAALAVTVSLPALASECSEQIKALDDRFQLAVAEPSSGMVVPPPTTADRGRLPPAAEASAGDNALLKGVPNTGGVQDGRAPPINAQQRDQIQQVLKEARNADSAGDATTCAAKVAEARRLAQGPQSAPTESGGAE